MKTPSWPCRCIRHLWERRQTAGTQPSLAGSTHLLGCAVDVLHQRQPLDNPLPQRQRPTAHTTAAATGRAAFSVVLLALGHVLHWRPPEGWQSRQGAACAVRPPHKFPCCCWAMDVCCVSPAQPAAEEDSCDGDEQLRGRADTPDTPDSCSQPMARCPTVTRMQCTSCRLQGLSCCTRMWPRPTGQHCCSAVSTAAGYERSRSPLRS